MELKDWFTIGIAGYGAILSTYIFVAQQRQKRPRVQVRLEWGVVSIGNPPHATEHLLIRVSNPGHRDVTISGVGVLAPNGHQLVIPIQQQAVPLPIESGKTYPMAARDAAEMLARDGVHGEVKLRGFCRDANGRRYVSKPLAFTPERWLKE